MPCRAKSFINWVYSPKNKLIFFKNIKNEKYPTLIKSGTNCFIKGVFVFEDDDIEYKTIITKEKKPSIFKERRKKHI